MNFLKKQNWWVCLLLNIITLGVFYPVLAKFMDCYDKDAWYSKWQYWFFGTLCLIFPVFIMLIVFVIQMNCKVASKLNVSGDKIYNTPYTWIVCFIVPVIGWILLIVMLIYVFVWPHVKLAGGSGEQYIK